MDLSLIEPFEDETAVNKLDVDKESVKSILVGIDKFCRLINDLLRKFFRKRRNACLISIDGYLGVEWSTIISTLKISLKKGKFKFKTFNFSDCYKSPKEIERIVDPYITWDPVFGKLWIEGSLDQFLDHDLLEKLRETLMKCRSGELGTVVICFGEGSSYKPLTDLYDYIFYIDLTRQELFRRARRGKVKNLGSGDVEYDDSGYIRRRFYHIDFPVLDKHKKATLPIIDYYIDGNDTENLKSMPRNVYEKILSTLAEYPIRLKPVYIPGVWGGQWLRKVRELKEERVNVAWSLEVVPYEQSILISLNDVTLDIPFLNLLWNEPEKIVGRYSLNKFNYDPYFEIYFFPISFNYDDTIEGGNMSVQVHPHYPYIKEYINEPYSHDESYYIVAVAPGSFVHFGLNDGVDKEKFYELAKKSYREKAPFDYTLYVNKVQTKPGDYFLIPAGTVHGSGKNELVLEIDANNSTELTFKIYDYLRPDLTGKFRPISLHHAFNVIKFHRTASWVLKHLKQNPRLIRRGDEWAEYVIGELDELFFVTHRLEFRDKVEDSTDGRFHILTLVEGKKILIQSKRHKERSYELKFTETVIIPACFSEYLMINLGDKPCKVVKALLK